MFLAKWMPRVFVSVVLAASIAPAARAGRLAPEVPLTNWSAPPLWSAGNATEGGPQVPAEGTGSRTALSRTAQIPAPAALPFVAITPCRLADTRPGQPFTGQYGQPFLAAAVERQFVITGQCGIPAEAQAVSFNFTVVTPFGSGFLSTTPTGTIAETSTLNYQGGVTIANAAVLQLGAGGAISVTASAATDLIIDVNGYYGPGVVTSLQGLTGDVGLSAGSNTQISPNGNGFQISSTGTLTGVTAGSGLTGGGTSGNPTLGIAAGGITADRIASGQVVKSLNGLTDGVTLAAGNNITIGASGNTLTIASPQATTGTSLATTSAPASSVVFIDFSCASGTLVSGACGYVPTDAGAADISISYSGPVTSGTTWRCSAYNHGSVARTITYGPTCSSALTAARPPEPRQGEARSATPSSSNASGPVVRSIRVIEVK